MPGYHTHLEDPSRAHNEASSPMERTALSYAASASPWRPSPPIASPIVRYAPVAKSKVSCSMAVFTNCGVCLSKANLHYVRRCLSNTSKLLSACAKIYRAPCCLHGMLMFIKMLLRKQSQHATIANTPNETSQSTANAVQQRTSNVGLAHVCQRRRLPRRWVSRHQYGGGL